MIDNHNRVVITGMGVLSPLGLNTSATWEALIAGKSGIDYITLFDVELFETRIAFGCASSCSRAAIFTGVPMIV